MKSKIKYNPEVTKKLVIWLILLAIVGLLGGSIVKSYESNHTTSNSKLLDVEIPSGSYENYLKVKAGINPNRLEEFDLADYWQYLNFPEDKVIYVDGNTAKASEDATDFVANYLVDGKKGYYTGENGTATWDIKNIPEAGLYHLIINYYMPQGGGSNAERLIKINDEVLFSDLNNITFYRVWADKEPIKQDISGNDLKPTQIEIFSERTTYLRDETGYVAEPFMIYFEAGDNTISFTSLRENLVIFGFEIVSVQTRLTYAEYLEEHKDVKKVSNYLEKIEAETAFERSSPTLYATGDRTSPLNTPADPVKTKYNSIGGSKWSTPGDWISWKVIAPEAGFYHISFRAKQNLSRGLFSTRRVYINDEIPFKEANNARFYYSSDWEIITIGNEEEKYLFYLKEGENTITLEATLGDYGDPISKVQQVIDDLSELYLKIISITTANPDEYQEYNLYGDNARISTDKKGRTMEKIFSDSANTLNKVSEYITSLTGEKSSLNNTLDKTVLQIGGEVTRNGKTSDLGGFASKPWNVTKDLTEFKSNLSALGTWILDIKEQSLMIECLWVHSHDAKLPNANANFFKQTWFQIKGFFLSFFFDYESIGVTSTEGFEKEIEVWYLTSESTGREQVNAVKNLIDTTFIPDTGINIILKILAPGVLLPATLAGTGPDVAINVGGGLPVNYALRGAIYDISQQEDFHKVTGICTAENAAKGHCTQNNGNYSKDDYVKYDYPEYARFQYSSMIPYELEGGYYALPNTSSFLVMFYRTDIFEENGWTVPKTWDDVKLLVTELQVSNLDFYLPFEDAGSIIYATLLYQMGGQFYRNDNKESDFDSEVGMIAFENWCSYFTDYSFLLAANFTNRFRTGEMPIGIASYELFNVLTVFAPDIMGKWTFAPLPGTYRADNTFNNSGVTSGTAVVVMEQAKDKDSSWEFLKWWTSSETQYSYARELESILGAAARHNTANIEAFKLLPWSKAEREILLSQWGITVGVPEVAGGYYVGRNLENAIRAVINNDANPRETFNDYIVLINSEITRKRKEFGLPVD